MLDLDKIESTLENVTDGPWVFDATGDWSITTKRDEAGWGTIIVSSRQIMQDDSDDCEYETISRLPDGEFMASARENVPLLIEECKLLRDENSYAQDNIRVLLIEAKRLRTAIAKHYEHFAEEPLQGEIELWSEVGIGVES